MLLLQTLGDLRLEGAGAASLSSRRKELVLLAYLARRGARPFARAEAAALLWEDSDERRARQSLRQALLELRRLVGEGLTVETDQLVLAPDAVELDATAFEQELDAGQLETAVSRWKGDFLPGVEEVGGEELRTWLEAERESLRRRLSSAFTQLVEAANRRGAPRDALAWAERWVAALPLEQRAHLHLLRLLYFEGRTSEAVRRHAAFRAQLRSNELEPSAELEQLSQLLERRPSSTQPSPTGSAALSTPDLIGRGAALTELDAAWRLAQQGRGSLVVVEGELGVGKTRLCEEFLRRVERELRRAVDTRAHAREGPAPVAFRVIEQLAAGLAGAPGLSGAPTSALAALAAVTSTIRDRFPTLPRSEADPRAVSDGLREALVAITEEQPTILLVDDLPQADLVSMRILLTLADRLPPGLMLLTTARTGAEDPGLILPSGLAVRRLKLQPLSKEDVELLVGSILELPAEDRHHLAARLHEHAGGNPLYIVELVSALADEGTLACSEHGAWRLTKRQGSLPLPSSLRDVLSWRVARLSPSARMMAEVAAVLGLPFDRELLAEIAGESPVVVEAGLDELIQHRLIREIGDLKRFEFAHELVRRHVYQGVPAARGEELSARVLAALEHRATDESAVRAAIAHHRSRASAVTAMVRRRRWRVGLIAAALLGTAGLIAIQSRTTHVVSPSAIAVLPFSVSGTQEIDYLREGMVTLLSTELDGVGTLRSVDPRAVIGMAAQGGQSLSQVEQGRQVAEKVGAGTYIVGDVVEGSGHIRIDAAAYGRDRPGRPLVRATVEGMTGQLFELVDAVAGRLLSGLSGGPYEQLTRLAATTTSSLPALKAYLDGEGLFRSGAFLPASRAFQRAVDEDSTFALAYYWLSVASWWADDSRAIDSAAAHAIRYGGRLAERDRRLFQAWDAFLRGDAPEAERVYRGILALEPENVEAWLQLGEVLFHSGPRRGRPLGEARKPFDRVVFFEPEHTSALLHLARIAASEGHHEELDSLARRILRLSPAGEWAVEVRALRSYAEGDLDEQRRVLEDLRTGGEGRVWNTARYVAIASHSVEGARQIVSLLTEATRPAEVRAFGYLGLAHLAAVNGRIHAAAASLDRAALLDPVPAREHRALMALLPFVPAHRAQLAALRDTLVRHIRSDALPTLETSHLANLHDGVHPELRGYLLAGLSLRMRDTMMAVRYVEQLERPRRAPEAAIVARDAASSIRAQIALHAGRTDEATREFEEVLRLEARVGLIGGSPFYSQGLERFLYAQALESLGRIDDAVRWYNSFSSNSLFDLVYLAPSHLRRGQIAERLGHSMEAREHYRRALELWKDCDPELRPLKQQAEDRLTQLASIP